MTVHVFDSSTKLVNRISNLYNSQGLATVCPPQLRRGLFTRAAVDNIDHNPNSTSAHDSFHGTGISLFQHPDSGCSGTTHSYYIPISDAIAKGKSLCLPEAFINISPAICSLGTIHLHQEEKTRQAADPTSNVERIQVFSNL